MVKSQPSTIILQIFCKPLKGTVIAIAHDYKTEPAQLECRYSVISRKLEIVALVKFEDCLTKVLYQVFAS